MSEAITDNLDLWSSALLTKSTAGRGRNGKLEAYGIKKLRELILELAVRGKLVPQDANDEPASELFKRIQAEKARLIAEGKIKKDKPLAPITEDEKPFELPHGWVWTRLGEITNFGATEKLDSISDETWVLDLEDVEKDTSKLLQKFRFSERRSLSDKNSFQSGDVLYGKLRPYLNKVVVADEAGVCTTEILPFRCYGPFDSHYFKDALKSPYFINYVNARSYGMKMPRLGTEDGRKACFPLPPLAEQHHIVAKVDELMAMCDQLEQQQTHSIEAHQILVASLLGTLTRVESQQEFSVAWARIASHFDTLFTTEASIDQLKPVILDMAVRGLLAKQVVTNTSAENCLKNKDISERSKISLGKGAEASLDKEIDPKEMAYKLPKSWRWVRLGKVVEISGGSQPPKSKFIYEPREGYTQLIQIRDFKNDDYPTYIPNEFANRPFSEDDIMIGRYGPPVFQILRGKKGSYNVALMKADPIGDCISKDYLFHLLSEPRIQRLVIGESERTAGQSGVRKELLYMFCIGLPPIEEQHRIVAKVDELMALCDALKARLADAHAIQHHLADAIVEQAVC